MFIAQPTSSFGDRICEELDLEADGHRQWQTFEFAAAWVNSSGAEKIKESARRFLAEGGCIRAVVGLDFASTSYEGLGILLGLETEAADIETYVFFDENRACTFHPKVYLFSNREGARLFVGSNNMTGGGLETNVEATLEFTSGLDDETIRAARQTLATWREDSLLRSRRLTREVLDQLHDQGYVRTDEEIRHSRISDAGFKSSQGEPLFGRSRTRAGRRVRGAGARGPGGGQNNGNGLGEALLMRVRPRRNGRQLQISMMVLEASFMHGATEVVSTGGSRRPIGYNEANGVRNTARFEAPEMMDMENPVARFQWVNAGESESGGNGDLQYEIFDAASNDEGARIFRKLEEGIATPPETNLRELSREETVLSKSDRGIAQWYRLDWV